MPAQTGSISVGLADSHVHFGCASRFEELELYLESNQVSEIGLLSLPDARRINFNPEVLFARAKLAGRSRAFASFDYADRFQTVAGGVGEKLTAIPIEEQVEIYARAGFDGLKLWEGKPTFQQLYTTAIDDESFSGAFRAAARFSMPVVLHVADPPIFWNTAPGAGPENRLGWSASGAIETGQGLPSFEELMRQTVAVLDRNPDCVLIFPHMLFLAGDLGRLSALLEAHGNAFLDLSPGLYFYGELHRQHNAAVDFFNTYRERILFGSDGMWFCDGLSHLPQSDLEANSERTARLLKFLRTTEELENPFAYTRAEIPVIRGLGLPGETIHAICRTNFRDRIWGAKGWGKTPMQADRDIGGRGTVEYLRGFLQRLRTLTSDVSAPAYRSAEWVTRYFDPQGNR